MTLPHRAWLLLVVGVLVLRPSVTLAEILNYDPALPAPAPVLDAGWASDTIFAADPAVSGDSPYAFLLPNPAIFTITDDFVTGDTYYVKDFGVPILTTTFFSHPGFVLDPSENSALANPAYSKGSILLAPGAHLLDISGDGIGGLPAGLFTRIDSVPEPSTLVMAGFGLVSLGAMAWRRRTRRARN